VFCDNSITRRFAKSEIGKPTAATIYFKLPKNFVFPAGLPDGFFHTKNPDLGKLWRALEWKML
jgi:hypothetical protein